MKYYVVSKIQDGKLNYGVISKKGKLIVPFEYDDIVIDYNCFICCRDKKWGILNDKLRMLVDFKYDSISFNGTFFRVRYNNSIGLLSSDGIEIIPINFDEIKISDNDNFITTNKNGKVGVYNKLGVLIPNEYDEIKPAKLGFLVRIVDRWGLLDFNNSFLIDIKYYSLSDSDGKDVFVAKENNKFGYLSLDGNWVIHPLFDKAKMFDVNDRAIVGVGYFSGLIDRKGRWIIKADSQSIQLINNVYVINKFTSINKAEYFDSNGKKLDLEPDTFNIDYDNNGFQSFTIDDKMGLKDESGNVIISANYEYILSINKVQFICYTNGKMGIINTKEEWLLEPKFEIPNWQIVRNIGVHLKSNGSDYFFDLNTHSNIKFKDEYKLGFFDDDGFVITKANSGKYGLLFCDGEWQIPPIYDYLHSKDTNGFIKAIVDGKHGWIDINGNWVIQPVFDNYVRKQIVNNENDYLEEDSTLESIKFYISETFKVEDECVYFENEITEKQKDLFKSIHLKDLSYLLFVDDSFDKSINISGILLCKEHDNYLLIFFNGCSRPVTIKLGSNLDYRSLRKIDYYPHINLLIPSFDKRFNLDCSGRKIHYEGIELEFNQYLFYFYNNDSLVKFCEMINQIIENVFTIEQ
jgi:hypothetical protein